MRLGRTIGSAGAATAAVAALVAAAPATASTGCSLRSWTAGTVELCHGRFVYRDYVDDDYGADTGDAPSQNWGSLARQSGDERYPEGAEGTADLVDLSLRVSRRRLIARFRLGALARADQTVAALAIDTDDNPATGGGPWGGLGVRSRGWDVLATFDHGDPVRNVVGGSMELPPGRRWRVQAVTAQRGGPVMNVAFRGTQEHGGWWEDDQAAALADGDISRFGATVEVADLLSRASRPAAAPGPGVYERVVRSRYSIPPRREGYSYEPQQGRAGNKTLFAQEYEFFGRFQPYGLYVPRQPAPHGIQLVMHGSGANMASLLRNDGLQHDTAEARNRVIVIPEARGRNGFYSDYSERDVLDALADVRRLLPIDRDRVFSGGYSMGGYGTFRMAALWPDRFAGFISWVGFTGDDGNGLPAGYHYEGGAIGNMADFTGNLRSVPGAMVYAGTDELVHVWTAAEMNRRFAAQGTPYIYYLYPTAEHLTFAVVDDWHNESDYTRDLRRVHNPPRVTFRTASFLDAPQLGIVHDRAYWVRDVRARRDGYADVDLTSRGCGKAEPVVAHRSGRGDDPLPWISEEGVVTGMRRLADEPLLEGSLANVRSLTVKARGACLWARPVRVDVDSDGPVELRLSDGRVVRLRAGHNRLTVSRRAR